MKKAYVVQKHDATTLHYDLRLEKGGVLKSWAVPKGIPEKKGVKRLAIPVDDHSLSYGSFEGIIEEGYGAGEVEIWDKGYYEEKKWEKDTIVIEIYGERIKGEYALIKTEFGWLVFRK
ncbi:MAG: DNA polymerase ligase N-terminal domain-containing protein [Euryarchaeota archaeon]|nr:DNA polymerase ligase N-terminal domain-containing protein [Euryarchaeota archaeon]